MTVIAAKWFYSGRRSSIRLIVVHCTVSPEMGTGAEDVARYFANLPATKKASAHKVCDNDSVVTCVADEDTAFAAAGANSDGLHLELVGQPTQTREEWLDVYSTHELAIAQTVVQDWSTNYDIPLRWLTVAEVADGVTKGVTTHADVSAAFPKVSTGHWDPGPNFPRDVFPVAVAAPQPTDPILKLMETRMKLAIKTTKPRVALADTDNGFFTQFDGSFEVDKIAAADKTVVMLDGMPDGNLDLLADACGKVRSHAG